MQISYTGHGTAIHSKHHICHNACSVTCWPCFSCLSAYRPATSDKNRKAITGVVECEEEDETLADLIYSKQATA